MSNTHDTLKISELAETIRQISAVQCSYYAEACAVALESQGQAQGVTLNVKGLSNLNFKLEWESPEKTAGWKEPKKYLENGAVAISFLLVNKLTKYEVVEEATIGTGFDYWLAYEDNKLSDPNNFMDARLEISGIGKETKVNSMEKRIKEKMAQTKPTDGTGLPAYVSIIEFGTPKAYFEKK